MLPITSWIEGSNCMNERNSRELRVESREPEKARMASRSLNSQLSTLNHASPARLAWRRFRNNRAAILSAFVLVWIVIGAILIPWVNHKARDAISDAQFQRPTRSAIFGAHELGGHVFARVFYGGGISLIVGFVTGPISEIRAP